MNKVWIASVLATLMLIVQLNYVVVTSETVDDCNCNSISDLHHVRIEKLLDRLESRIDIILSKYGHIPEVKEKCKDLLELTNSYSPGGIFCKFLHNILDFIENFFHSFFGLHIGDYLFEIIFWPLVYIYGAFCY